MTDQNKAALDAADSLAEPFEGCVLHVYPDPATGGAPWTEGFGSTRGWNGQPLTKDSPPITKQTAVAWLRRDMTAALQAVLAAVTIPLDADEEGALADFVYNLGAGNFDHSTLLRMLNDGDIQGAAQQFELWDHAGGKVMAGLLRRRTAERAMFEKGVAAAGAPVAITPEPVATTPEQVAAPAPRGGFFGAIIRFILSLFGRK